MTNELTKLREIFRKVFQNDRLLISEATTAKDIPMWDSLTHLELIATVEEEFGIKFSFNEVMSFDSVGDMLKAISRK
jgi:acyl carrier protein